MKLEGLAAEPGYVTLSSLDQKKGKKSLETMKKLTKNTIARIVTAQKIKYESIFSFFHVIAMSI